MSKRKKNKKVEKPKVNWKLGVFGGLVLSFIVGYSVSQESKPTDNSIASSRSEKGLVGKIEKYAKVTPAREIQPDKPSLFYIGQSHVEHSVNGSFYAPSSLENQVKIYHILDTLLKENNLKNVYLEGWKGKYPIGTVTPRLRNRLKSASDVQLKTYLRRNPDDHGASLLFCTTGFDNFYGFSSVDQETAGRLQQETMNRIRFVKERIIESSAKNSVLELSLKVTKQYAKDLSYLVSEVNQVANDSIINIQNLPGYNDGTDAVVIAGAGHIADIKRMDSNGHINHIHDSYNLIYVVPNGTNILKKNDDPRTSSLNDIRILNDLIKKAEDNNQNFVKIH